MGSVINPFTVVLCESALNVQCLRVISVTVFALIELIKFSGGHVNLFLAKSQPLCTKFEAILMCLPLLECSSLEHYQLASEKFHCMAYRLQQAVEHSVQILSH